MFAPRNGGGGREGFGVFLYGPVYRLVCYITWLDTTVDDLKTRPLHQILG